MFSMHCWGCGMRWEIGTPRTCICEAAQHESVAWKWHQAPVKTSWGHEMVVADLAIDKDNTVSVYCERDQTAKVEAMFTPPAAQPAPVVPDVMTTAEGEHPEYVQGWNDCRQLMLQTRNNQHD